MTLENYKKTKEIIMDLKYCFRFNEYEVFKDKQKGVFNVYRFDRYLKSFESDKEALDFIWELFTL